MVSVLVAALALALHPVLHLGHVRAAAPPSIMDVISLDRLGDFQEECANRCPFQNKTDDGIFEVGCGIDCKIEQCSKGCRSWKRALETSCQTVCNGTQELLPPKELYCVMGCNDAVNMYFQKLKDEIGTPPAPALVADTLTANSLSLEWEGTRYANISYLVQWRYEELAGAWQYCRNQSWGPYSTVRVENLQPYTKYRFRVALLLSPHHSEPVVSAPSVVISTLPHGVPASPPTIVRATAVDWGRVSVSWEPGPFPNGPILSYVLQISELPQGYSALKDVPASENTDFYMFQNLVPSRRYNVSVAMRNGVGEGPAASAVVATPAEPAARDAQQPVLVLGARHSVTRQAADMLDEPVVVYRSEHRVTGVALHVARRLLFVSDSAGVVWRTALDAPREAAPILAPHHTRFRPQGLSVDWLNDLLYVVGELRSLAGPSWQVARAGLDGRGLTVAVAGIPTKPLHVEVDPYNGFLYWVLSGERGGGLYRLDLADVSNGIKHEARPALLLEDPRLGAFVVDHTNFRLLVPHHANNTVLAVSLDGREVTDLRKNTQQPMFQNVVSLAMANGLFYWTNGEEVLTEEYHAGQDSYFHNTYPNLADRSFVSVSVDVAAAQPVPVPVNPPTSVQAVLGAELAKVSWQVPHLLGGQGKGAWQNWSYILSIWDNTRGLPRERHDVNATWCTLHGLLEDTEYVVKAAAYTSAGTGPWSTEFRARSLRRPHGGELASVLWSASEGLLQSDVTGDDVRTLVHSGGMQDAQGTYHVTDMAWFRDRLYLVANTSHVYSYNLTSRALTRLRDVDNVGSIAVDWIGKKLYWSNPKQQLITRSNLNGSQQEPLPILTVAKELNMDAVQAYLYWSTGHAVECARLNGKNRRTYYPAELFSGKHVMGLTLDLDSRAVYWIVRSYEGAALYRAPMAEEFQPGEEVVPVRVSQLQHPNMQGPLCYFSNHLLWLQDDRNAVIGDLSGQNAAVISGMSLSGLHTVAAMDTTLHHIPGITSGEVNVIPEAIVQSSIRVSGSWEAFNISWDPVGNVNYGQVFYEVKIRLGQKKEFVQETVECSLACCGLEAPPAYSQLLVTVRALTYWGASPQVQARLRSPSAQPGEPHNPRVFVSYQRPGSTGTSQDDDDDDAVGGVQDITAVFRWDPPREPNGVVERYIVKHWYSCPDGAFQTCDPATLSSDRLEYEARFLEHNCTYYFQVQAFTIAGGGPLTAPVSANTAEERPVPRLLLATLDAVLVQDCDRRADTTLLRSAAPPVDLAFLSRQHRVVWLSETQELRTSTLDGRNKTKLAALGGPALSVAVDWVGRAVYWSEQDETGAGASRGSSSLMRLYLDRGGAPARPATVLRRSKTIRQIAVAPLSSTLLWIEVGTSGVGTLMSSSIDGSKMRPFFSVGVFENERLRRSAPCSCPENPGVGLAMALDHSAERPQLLWSDAWTGHVLAADLDGCSCAVLVNATLHREAGLPPSSLTADGERLYWTNSSLGRLYSAPKQSDGERLTGGLAAGLTAREMTGVRRIAALGPHLQPYPPMHCLFPGAGGVPMLAERSPYTLHLTLPTPERPPDCQQVSTAPTAYTVYHGPVDSHDGAPCAQRKELCRVTVTYDPELQLSDLQPFTRYVVMVALSNYYNSEQAASPGPPVVFQTAAGAPTPPREVGLRALDPGSVRVSWLPPQQLHSEAVWYELHWRAEGPGLGARTSGQHVVSEGDGHSATLTKLAPGQNYVIWVRAHAQGSEAHTDSRPLSVRTLPQPGPLTLLEATPYSLTVSWRPAPNVSVQSCALEYLEAGAGAGAWLSQPLVWPESDAPEPVLITVTHLQPKTKYSFRLQMMFPHAMQAFLWPADSRFTFETLGDRPTPPGTPSIQHLQREVYQVTWHPSQPNGSPVQTYTLEGWVRELPGQPPEPRHRREAETDAWAAQEGNSSSHHHWTTLYNGSDNYWIVSELRAGAQYVFRARALNEYGWSNWSAESRSFDLSEAALLAEQQELGIVLGVSIPAVLALCLAGLVAVMCVNRRREQEKKALQVGGMAGLTGLAGAAVRLDVELATLRELPRRGNFVHRTNTLYSAADASQDGPTDEEVALLPHIRRQQITLTKFLGSGAFGEVFEGKARDVGDTLGEIRVAVKTLRKGATEQEKSNFLKEAQLMSHFKHAHILQLLGVCLDNDPNFIIMELMEGGDLLGYLRGRRQRPHTNATSALSLQDLLAMCVDVARGCRYMEEMHFVHRDLACRNCLVSSLEPASRVVKIGDFGLARDIYKNDYYRKEGEGMLPVRWMAPESLVDGVFTCQSDVWSFGVLVWEVMTLGQQPYPARTNIEVLHYVRGGGRLGRPNNCPEDLHNLMLKCWLYSPEARPTFKYCLQVLEDLKAKIISMPSPNLVNGGIANRGFFEDENRNNSGDSWKSVSDGAGSGDRVPFLSSAAPAGQIPKYLELIYDADEDERTSPSPSLPAAPTSTPCTRDGYEVPRPPQSVVTVAASPAADFQQHVRTVSTSSTFSESSATSNQALVNVTPPGYTNVAPAAPAADSGGGSALSKTVSSSSTPVGFVLLSECAPLDLTRSEEVVVAAS